MTHEAMISFWVREDEQRGDLPDIVVREAENWLRRDWSFDGHLWRVREEETRSNLALERAGLRGRYGLDVNGIERYAFFA